MAPVASVKSLRTISARLRPLLLLHRRIHHSRWLLLLLLRPLHRLRRSILSLQPIRRHQSLPLHQSRRQNRQRLMHLLHQ